MNKQPLTAEQLATLEKVRQIFSDWRKTRTSRRMPGHLWQAAANLYHNRGMSINRIARSLRLNHSALKAKIIDMPADTVEPPVEDPAPMFIEVPPAPALSDCVIEMENPSGAKMRMCFRGRADPAMLSLGRYFLAGAS